METPMFVARILFFGADKGGRNSPPQTGYHPQIDIHGIHTSCVIESLDGEVAFSFNREHRVSLKLMFPDQYPDALKVGDAVNLYEGSKLIGTGRVIEAR
jgi:translation elongation factor EF-Tu-like GTPase